MEKGTNFSPDTDLAVPDFVDTDLWSSTRTIKQPAAGNWLISTVCPNESQSQQTFVKPHSTGKKLLNHIMRNRAGLQMLDDELHLGVVRKAAILAFEAKVRRMQVYRE
jgi:hypothetical protein